MHIREFKRKLEVVGPEFELTPGMESEGWKKAGWKGRGLVMRVSMHGMHGQFCERSGYHEWEAWCKCKWCGEGGDFLHWKSCPSELGAKLRWEVGRAMRGGEEPEGESGGR